MRVKGTFEVEFEEEYRELLNESDMAEGLTVLLEEELFPGYLAENVKVEFLD